MIALSTPALTISTLPTHFCQLLPTQRRLAYSEVGDPQATQVLLCLPGLLETRATFEPLLKAAQHVRGLRIVSLDHCGRGDSDPLSEDSGYSMSVYLQDTAQWVRQVLMTAGSPAPRIELLGTSMGGILAMYLAQDPALNIRGLFLNDIGLSLNWMSIYGLHDSMKEEGLLPDPQVLSQRLNVRVGAVLAVQATTHFDLPYKKDWKGMKFAHLLKGFHGPVRLMHGSESGVFTQEQVHEVRRMLPHSVLLEVMGARHPVPFTDTVNQFVLNALQVQPQSPQPLLSTQQELWAPTTTPDQDQGFWPWLKRRYLNATTK